MLVSDLHVFLILHENIPGNCSVPIPSIYLYSYFHSLRGNHLPSKSQLVGHTVSTEALATDAIKVIAKYDLPVSH